MQQAKPIEPGCLAYTYGMDYEPNNWKMVTVICESGLPEDVEANLQGERSWKISETITVMRPRNFLDYISQNVDEWEHKQIDVLPERFLLRIDPDEKEKDKSVPKNIEEAA